MSLLSNLRLLFTFGRGVTEGLPDATERADPFVLFGKWFEGARRAGVLLPESMTVATATRDGRPSARIMLLKSFDSDGFVFYTNYGSRKAAEIDENPQAALVFHWAVLQRQVRVEGGLSKTSADESYDYFRSRPRGSRIGAWASRQSAPLGARAELEQRVQEIEQQYAGKDIPLPSAWGGYRLAPERIEFWQGRANRLHDRVVFTREDGGWRSGRLYP